MWSNLSHQINPNGQTSYRVTGLYSSVRRVCSAMWGHSKKTAIYKPGNGPSLNAGVSTLVLPHYEKWIFSVSRKVSIHWRTGEKKKKRKVSWPWRTTKSWRLLQVNAESDPVDPGQRKRLPERTLLRHLVKFSVAYGYCTVFMANSQTV